MRYAEFTMESGYKKPVIFWEKKMISISYLVQLIDTIAAGVIEAIKEISPRRQIQVTGFGDNQFLKAVTGGIRTVHFGYKTSGVKGTQLLLEMIESEEMMTTEIKLGYKLV